MSKPIAYAATKLGDELHMLTGKPFQAHHVDSMAVETVRAFLEDAKSEGRFDAATIDALLNDL